MIKYVAALSIIFSIVFSSGTNGEVHEFELPELAGMTADTSLTTMLVYHGPSGEINSLSARVAGNVDYLGLIECLDTPPDTSEWVLDIGTLLRKPRDTGYWIGSPGFLDHVGPFDEMYIHHTYSNGFSTIADGDSVEVDMYFYPAPLVGICHPITAPSTGTLLRASILLDVSASTPAEKSTWGGIKELFRTSN